MEISLLLGAGFSAPDGYPTRKELNLRLSKINRKEILVHTDGTAMFLNGQEDPNADWTRTEEKLFIEQFLDFYNSRIIENEDFDYETFYDYYQGLHLGRTNCAQFEEFAEDFRKKYSYEIDNTNLLGQFHNTFNQLLASQLMKWPKNVHLAKYYTKYPAFLNFMEEVREHYEKIQIHTLNHDLLMEELSVSDAIQSDLSDGFQELGSPFYSKNTSGQTVRLRCFTNEFDSKFCLYKLHGSIDQYIYNFKNEEFLAVKVPYAVDSSSLMKEYTNEDGVLEYDRCWWNYYPDFLSGTTEKINSYGGEHYYKPIFEHFMNNLKNSKHLICIGYGLGDSKINELIKEHFLSDKTKMLIVISPTKPSSDLFDYDNVKYYGDKLGVENIDFQIINDKL